MFRFSILFFGLSVLLYTRSFSQANFIAPDTVCVNTPVSVQNTSLGATTYFWNFCSGSLYGTPQITNLGNTGGVLNMPSFLATAKEGNNYYAFVVNFGGGSVVRLAFGSSMLNTPVATDLGTFGGVIPLFTEGVQVVQDAGGWHVIVVGGSTASTSKIIKLDFGTSLANTPTITDWGNLGSLNYPQDLYIVKEGLNWYGLAVNKFNNTVTRFSFGTSFANPPAASNLGSLGNLSDPTGIFAVQENGNWYVFITNESSNELVRYDFGTSLGNTPTSTSLGNPGNVLNGPRDLCIIHDCGGIFALAINHFSNDLVRLDFNGDITTTSATGVSLGGGFSFPVSISTIFREGNSLYAFITNVNNNTLSRLEFNSCNSSSIASSTQATPPAVTYNTPGTYAVHLLTNESLPTQSTFCKEIVVMPALALKLGKDTLICNGSSLLLDAGAGTAATRYNWNTGATTRQITATTSGTYVVSVTNGGCTAKDTINVTIGVPMSLNTPVLTHLNCNTTGKIEVHPTGGVRPFHYYLNGIDRNTDSVYNITVAGNYTVRVTDALGCVISGTYGITGHGAPTVKLGNDTALCAGKTVLLSGGAGFTSYLWSTGATSQIITAAATGTYFVEVSNGFCIARDTINVAVGAPMSLNTPVLTHLNCNTTGKIEVHPTGGIRPFHYYLNGVDRTTDSVYNITLAGSYSVRVVDSTGCEVSGTYSITGHGIPSIQLGTDTVTCGGMPVGLDAGAGYVSYLWSTGAVSQTITATTTGTYFVEVNDGICIGKDTINVVISVPMSLNTPLITDIDCNNPSGKIEVHPTGGTRPFHYYLNGVDRTTDSVYTSLTAGKYIVRVVDAVGCEISDSYDIVTIPPIIVKLGSDTTVCAGTTLTLTAVPGYTNYLWNTGALTQTITVTQSGTYNVTVTDNNCFGRDTINIRISEPFSLNTPLVTNIDCGIPFGKIEVHPTGGTRPYSYFVNGVSRNSDSVYTQLSAGDYQVIVVDSTNCTVSQTIAVIENTATIIRATGTGIPPTCYGRADGSINIQVQKGTAPFEYAIKGQSYQPDPTFTDLAQGVYRIYIRNTVCIDSVDVQLVAPVAFTLGVTAIDEVCERGNGSVGITAAGGVTPYSIYWDNVLLDSAGVSGLSTGTYSLNVVDANGCGVDTSINIYNVIIPPVQIMNHDTIVNIGDAFQLNAVNAVDYVWTPVDGLSCTDCASPVAKPLKPVTYIVNTVTGLNCVPADTINITLTYNRSLYAPNAFSPNKDGQNDVFRVKGRGVAIYHLSVYNRWGQLIFVSDNMNAGWDGFYKSELQPAGGYVYVVQYAFYGDEKNLLMQKGSFTLIR